MLLRCTSRFVPLTFSRFFNWKYPYPKELQPSPPCEERINQKNILELKQPLSENDVFNTEFINKNPRNLEQMLLEVKPNGYVLDKPSVVYWNKLYFEKSSKHSCAKVVHNSGRTVISVSTKDWAFRKYLYSAIDNNAVLNIARVLAHRCLESGILFVHHEFSEEEMKTPKIQLLLEILEEEGLKTEELTAIRLKDQFFL